MKNTLLPTLLVLMLLLSSCAGTSGDPFAVKSGHKGQVGAIGGAAGGALLGQAIGHSTEATLIGVAIGTMLGYMVGSEMDKYDAQRLNYVYERGVSGQTSTWINPDKGQRMVIPQPAYNGPQGRPCRKAEISAIIDGRTQSTYTTACRDPYGSWQLQ
jgi:surface antigen